MSVEAISWALNLAPVQADRATLVRYTGLAKRKVRTCLHRLAAEGIIACDPGTR